MINKSFLAVTLIFLCATTYAATIPQNVVPADKVAEYFGSENYTVVRLSREGERQCALLQSESGYIVLFLRSFESSPFGAVPVKGVEGPRVFDAFNRGDMKEINEFWASHVCS